MNEYIRAVFDGLAKYMNAETPLDRRAERSDTHIQALIDQCERLRTVGGERSSRKLADLHDLVVKETIVRWEEARLQDRSRGSWAGRILATALSIAALGYTAEKIVNIYLRLKGKP